MYIVCANAAIFRDQGSALQLCPWRCNGVIGLGFDNDLISIAGSTVDCRLLSECGGARRGGVWLAAAQCLTGRLQPTWEYS